MTTLRLDAVAVAGADRPRLDAVCCTLEPGQPILLVGPNGAGKSTLVRVLAGLLPPTSGRVLLDDTDLSTLPRRARAGTLAWLPQHPRPEVGLTARELVAAARYRFAEPMSAAHRHADDALAALGLSGFAHRRMEQLSGGEAQRVRLASLLAQDTAWWLLDEPANHLDPAVARDLRQVVADRTAAGGGALVVTHDLSALPHLPDARVLVLDGGRLVADLGAADAALPDALTQVFGVRIHAVDVDGRRHLVPGGAP